MSFFFFLDDCANASLRPACLTPIRFQAPNDDARYAPALGSQKSEFSGDEHDVSHPNLSLESNVHEGFGHAQTESNDNRVAEERPHGCTQCSAAYRRLGDLTRHQQEKHSAASSKNLCHIELCPRSIATEGFGRMHHLVAHLKSNKHGIDGKEAAYVARQHNLPKSKASEGVGRGRCSGC